MRKISMQDLMQSYASDLKKLRDLFHKELTATAEELSKALALYAHRSDAALASFMEKASARSLELEVSATARLNQFCGLPATGGLPDVDDRPPTLTLTHSDAAKIAAPEERTVADVLHVGSDGDRKPQPGRSISPVEPGQAA
jgi:hypothetical protein